MSFGRPIWLGACILALPLTTAWGDTLTGVITNATTGTPLSGVTVTIASLSLTRTTNASGAYDFGTLADGTYSVTAQAANFVTQQKSVTLGFSLCDINADASTTVGDVQLMVNQAIGVAHCTADINSDGVCNVIDVQRVVIAALGGTCVTP